MSLIGDLQWQTTLTVTVVCHQGSPGGSAGKESACNAEDLGEGNGYPLQYSGLKDSMDWVHGITKSQTRLINFHFHVSYSSIKQNWNGKKIKPHIILI